MKHDNGGATGRFSLPAGVWVLGCGSLFMDTSSEMIHSILPVFMASVLGASMITIGVIEGVAEATAAVTKVFSGALSDYLGNEAREMLGQLPEEALQDSEIAAAKTALDLAQEGQSAAGDTAGLEAKVNANPNDHQARFDLAAALYSSGNAEAAIDHLLEIVSRDRKWEDDGARKRLIEIFDALGPTNPLTVAGRRKLSSMLFA